MTTFRPCEFAVPANDNDLHQCPVGTVFEPETSTRFAGEEFVLTFGGLFFNAKNETNILAKTPESVAIVPTDSCNGISKYSIRDDFSTFDECVAAGAGYRSYQTSIDLGVNFPFVTCCLIGASVLNGGGNFDDVSIIRFKYSSMDSPVARCHRRTVKTEGIKIGFECIDIKRND
jgi:hypothetical protein